MANVSDNFNRANAVLGGNWTQLVASQGQFTIIVSNEIGSDTAGSYSAAAWNANAFAANQFSKAIITNDAESFGLVLRANIAADRQFYVCYSAFGEIYIARQNGALRTDLVNTTVAWDIGDEILFEAESTTLRVRQNGAVVLSTTDVTYATGAPCVYFGFGTTARMDDWVGGPIAGGLREPATRRMSFGKGGLTGGMQW